MRLHRKESGQTGTEYMLMISVAVVAIVAGAYVLVPSFQDGASRLGADVSTILDTHQIAGMGVNTNPGAGTPGGGGPNGGGQANGNGGGTPPAGVYQEKKGLGGGWFDWLGISTTSTASNTGTGGQDVATNAITDASIDDRRGLSENSGGSYLTGDVQSALEGSDLDPTDPNCGAAVLAALAGETFDSDFKDSLADGGFLENVRTDWKIGDTTLFSTEGQPGVMAANQIERYLREELGWETNYQQGAGFDDVEQALDKGQEVVVLYDRGPMDELTGNNNHFAVAQYVTDWTPDDNAPPGPYILLDHIGGREYMTVADFEKRFQASGGHVVTGDPPLTRTGDAVASNYP